MDLTSSDLTILLDLSEMPFGQLTATPIIIESDDEDDDILLVKEEKIPHNLDKDDDVIFISKEEPVGRGRTSTQDKLKRTVNNAPIENSTLAPEFPSPTFYSSSNVTDNPPSSITDTENFDAALNSSRSFDVSGNFLTAPVPTNDSSLNSGVPALKILKLTTESPSKWHIVQNNEHNDVAKPKHHLDNNANCFCSLKGLPLAGSSGSHSQTSSLYCCNCTTLQINKSSQNISTSSTSILPDSDKSLQNLSSFSPDYITTNGLNLPSNFSGDKPKIGHLFKESFEASDLHPLIHLEIPRGHTTEDKCSSHLEIKQIDSLEMSCSSKHLLTIGNAKKKNEHKFLLKRWMNTLQASHHRRIKNKSFRKIISDEHSSYSDNKLIALKCQTPCQAENGSKETRRDLLFEKTDIKKGQLIQLAKKIKYHYFVNKKQNSNLDKSVLKLLLPLNHLTSLPFNKRKCELKRLRKNVLNYPFNNFSVVGKYLKKRKLYGKDKHKFNDGNHAEWRVVPPSSSGHVKLRLIKVGATSQCTDIDKETIVETQQIDQVVDSPEKEQKEEYLLEETGSIVNKENSLVTNEVVCYTCASFSRNVSKCEKGHIVCGACLEVQVKNILAGESKQKHVKCPLSACNVVLPFEELKQSLPSFVVDVIEEKFDKAYLQYITQWMFTNEKLKSRSEFATSEVLSSTIDTPPTENTPVSETSLSVGIKKQSNFTKSIKESPSVTEDSPKYWLPMEHGATVMVYEVVPDTEEYKELAFLFHETLEFPNYDIVRILRIQNSILWKYFALKKSEMVQENNGLAVTEKQLFHGTHRTYVEAIARKGFDWRLSGKHGTVYGCGSYFAKESKYSHGYTDRGGDGISARIGTTPSHQPFGHVSRNLMVSAFRSRLNNYLSGQSLTQQPVVPQSYMNFSAPSLQPSCSFQSPPAPSLPATVNCVGMNSHSGFFNSFFNSVNQPAHFNSVNQTPHLNSMNQPAHLNSMNQPAHLNSVGPVIHYHQPSSSMTYGFSSQNNVQNTDMSSISQGDSAKVGVDEDNLSLITGTADLGSVFSKKVKADIHSMFVARVLVGRPTRGSSGLKRPPPIDENCPLGKCYDSCVDTLESPKIFVVFDSNQCYPEYLIEYTSTLS